MIKRTPQEIADFFQCYVAQDEDGTWYMYKDKPMRNEDRGIWVGSIDDPLRIPYMTVEIPGDHFWTILYEPQSADSINKEASCSGKAPVSDNKPDHASEVYTHKEFRIESHTEMAPLASKITALMNEGWMPSGGLVVEHLPMADGYVEDGQVFYVAMVRGV